MVNNQNITNKIKVIKLQRGLTFGAIIVAALLFFEIFNFSTTDYALTDLLGDISFGGMHWSTILAIAFCGIDFAGIARIFTPEEGANEPAEVWYLFGAWLLAATMNATLTWWGISIAILNNHTLGNEVISKATMINIVPIFVAVLVWLSRVLLIGTFSVAGERLFSQRSSDIQYSRTSKDSPSRKSQANTQSNRIPSNTSRRPVPAYQTCSRPKPQPVRRESSLERPEPTYHPIAARTKDNSQQTSQRQSRF